MVHGGGSSRQCRSRTNNDFASRTKRYVLLAMICCVDGFVGYVSNRENVGRFGLRLRTGYTTKAQTAPEQDHVYGVTVGRAGKGVWTHPISGHLHQGRIGPAHQTDRSQDTGANGLYTYDKVWHFFFGGRGEGRMLLTSWFHKKIYIFIKKRPENRLRFRAKLATLALSRTRSISYTTQQKSSFIDVVPCICYGERENTGKT